ncbi:MAG: hypothetical protein OEV60_04180 [Actinomycetota bacterium]|nr:hypothetical protein [Actinomycetota bacterium]MDH5224713.1 hypothetical protein [Actinomycetota bacterium]MDH5313719.1 hypothetical protein [Actinomycetota bacterium]
MVIGAGAIACLGLATPAVAQDTGGGREQIVLSGRIDVDEGETLNRVVIFNGPAAIAGRVTESVIVFNGRTTISGTVGGDVVVFNGSVTVRSGATIGGDLVTVDSPAVEPDATIRGEQRRMNTDFDAARFGFASRIAWWIGYTVSTLLLGLVLLALAPGADNALAVAARERTGAAIGLGAAAFFLLPVAAVLLLAIIVAIPLGLFLLLALALVYTFGYVAGAHVLGRRLVKPPKSRFAAFLAGWAILRAIALIPVLGGLVWLLTAIFGLGVLWVAARRTGTAEHAAPGSPSVPPMPQPAG